MTTHGEEKRGGGVIELSLFVCICAWSLITSPHTNEHGLAPTPVDHPTPPQPDGDRWSFGAGTTPGVHAMRLSLDPLAIKHRPCMFYMGVRCAQVPLPLCWVRSNRRIVT